MHKYHRSSLPRAERTYPSLRTLGFASPSRRGPDPRKSLVAYPRCKRWRQRCCCRLGNRRLLRQQPPHGIGVDVVFFDAEDMGAPSDAAMFCLGSKYFAANFPLPLRPRYGILFDLVGDHQARFFIEETSQQAAPSLVERLWKLGRLYGNGTFVEQRGGSVVDDHHALIELGIPTVDIIDLELVGNQSPIERRRYWHTRMDDMRNISGQTLQSVATVVLALLYSDTPFPL